jgi:hypothetical protein
MGEEVPHWTKLDPVMHRFAVGQEWATPSQVTDDVPTEQLVAPLQVRVDAGAEQERKQELPAGGQLTRAEQASLQVRVAVHPVAMAGDGRSIPQRATPKSAADRIFIIPPGVELGRWYPFYTLGVAGSAMGTRGARTSGAAV